jgi:HEPN superfamily RiboL-PSP-like protein
MAEQTPIDRLYNEATATIHVLQEKSEWSLQSAAADHFRKALLLATASYFEDYICNSVAEFVREQSKSALIDNFVRNKAIARQYHTWFSWDKKNANQFFGLFGVEFRTMMADSVKTKPELQSAIEAFLELGNERNSLVHQNYATFPMEKTLEEIYFLYQRALIFVSTLPSALRDGNQLSTM